MKSLYRRRYGEENRDSLTRMMLHEILLVMNPEDRQTTQQSIEQNSPSSSSLPGSTLTQSSTPPLSHSKTKLMLFGFIAVLFVLAFLIGGFVLGTNKSKTPQHLAVSPTTQPSPTSDPTADWKEYTNTKVNYSVKYPTSFTIYENKVPSADGVLASSPNSTVFVGSENDNFNIVIEYDNKTKFTNLDSAFKIQSDCVTEKSIKETYILDGQTGYIFKDTLCGLSGETLIYVLKDGLLFITHIESHEPYEKIKPNVNQILSTFKFTQ